MAASVSVGTLLVPPTHCCAACSFCPITKCICIMPCIVWDVQDFELGYMPVGSFADLTTAHCLTQLSACLAGTVCFCAATCGH
jgi:hypothetical protein